MTNKIIKVELLLNTPEREKLDHAMQALQHDKDPRDVIIASLFTQMSDGEETIMHVRGTYEEAMSTPAGKIFDAALDIKGMQAKAEEQWAKKHGRLRTAIIQILDTYK